jgi:hypothetical protein
MANIKVINSTSETSKNGCKLMFQKCELPEGEIGYRFMLLYPNGKLKPLGSGAQIPSTEIIRKFLDKADKEGW